MVRWMLASCSSNLICRRPWTKRAHSMANPASIWIAPQQSVRRRTTRREMRKLAIGVAFISPWIAGFLAFTLYPVLSSFYYSLTDYNLFSSPKWVGAENYLTLLTDDHLARTALWNTIYMTIFGLPLGV